MRYLTPEERIAILETYQETMAKDINEMKTNHLPHIERKIDSLIKWMMGALFSALLAIAGITASIIVQFLLHSG